jgi:hypothetical protein
VARASLIWRHFLFIRVHYVNQGQYKSCKGGTYSLLIIYYVSCSKSSKRSTYHKMINQGTTIYIRNTSPQKMTQESGNKVFVFTHNSQLKPVSTFTFFDHPKSNPNFLQSHRLYGLYITVQDSMKMDLKYSK